MDHAESADVILGILFSLMTAALSVFFQACMEPGMIFRRYYLWLTYWWIKNRKRENRKWRALLKVLGMCVYCNGTWIHIITFSYFLELSPIIIFTISLNFIFIKLYERTTA